VILSFFELEQKYSCRDCPDFEKQIMDSHNQYGHKSKRLFYKCLLKNIVFKNFNIRPCSVFLEAKYNELIGDPISEIQLDK